MYAKHALDKIQRQTNGLLVAYFQAFLRIDAVVDREISENYEISHGGISNGYIYQRFRRVAATRSRITREFVYSR